MMIVMEKRDGKRLPRRAALHTTDGIRRAPGPRMFAVLVARGKGINRWREHDE